LLPSWMTIPDKVDYAELHRRRHGRSHISVAKCSSESILLFSVSERCTSAAVVQWTILSWHCVGWAPALRLKGALALRHADVDAGPLVGGLDSVNRRAAGGCRPNRTSTSA
jgi:hypothetical protein